MSLLVMRLKPFLSIGDRGPRLVIVYNRQRCETLFHPKSRVMPTQPNFSVEKNVCSYELKRVLELRKSAQHSPNLTCLFV